MAISDILEWLGALCLVAAAYLWHGPVVAFAVAGPALIYFAHVYDAGPKPPNGSP